MIECLHLRIAANMPLNLICPNCKKRHQAPESLAGRACRCQCGHIVHVPEVTPARLNNTANLGSLFDELSSRDIDRLKTSSNPPVEGTAQDRDSRGRRAALQLLGTTAARTASERGRMTNLAGLVSVLGAGGSATLIAIGLDR